MVRKKWLIKDGYTFNPLIPVWWEESVLGGCCQHLSDEKINLFNRYGVNYWFVGSAAKHFVLLALDDPEFNGQKLIPKLIKHILYWGSFTIYSNNMPIFDGKIWQAIPCLTDPNPRGFPHFIDLLLGPDTQHRRRIDDAIQLVKEKSEEVLEEYYRLEEIKAEIKNRPAKPVS